MGKRRRTRILAFLMSALLGALMLACLLNSRIPLRAAKRFLLGEEEFAQATDDIRTDYAGNLFGKRAFICLNGWLAARLGQSSCNGVVKLKNGMLTTETVEPLDVAPLVESVAAFRDYLAERGIAYLHIQAPYKVDPKGILLPEGYVNFANQNADALLDALRSENIDALDLRPALSATPEKVDAYFLRTDNHWNFTGAFIGYQEIVARLRELFPARVRDLRRADFAAWEEHVRKDWCLGYWGKRVGIYYTGVDDFTYYTPRFETSISRAIPSLGTFRKGDFSEAVTIQRYIEQKNYMGDDAYKYAVGGLYPLVQYRNPDAPSDLHILMIGDSYTLPLQCNLSTMFQCVDAVVPSEQSTRMFSIAELAKWSDADVVITLFYPMSLFNLTMLGTESAVAHETLQPAVALEPMTVAVQDGDERGNFQALPVEIAPGGVYLLEFDGLRFDAGSSDGITALLYDPVGQEIVNSAIFDVEYCASHGGFRWHFAVPEDAGEQLQLILFAGLLSDSGEIRMTCTGVRLTEYK